MSGVTTGSILNQRVYNRGGGSGSSSKGSGVQRSALTQTRITLANRNNKTSGRTSYTALSNQINGRKEVIYVGGGSNCCGTSSMSTMEKIAMWSAIAQQGLQLGQGIASLFGAGKADKTGSTGNTKGSSGTGDVGGYTPTTQPKVNQNIRQTSTDVTNSSTILSAMENADGSAALEKAIIDAEAYLNGDLSTRVENANVKANEAQKRLDSMEKDNELAKAEEAKGTAQQNVNTLKENINKITGPMLENSKSDLVQAENELGELKPEYKKAVSDRREAEKTKAQADKNVTAAAERLDKANQGVTTAEANFKAAEDDLTTKTNSYNSLKAQYDKETDPTKKAALKTQVDTAKAAMDAAETKKKEAEKALEDAKTEQKTAAKNKTDMDEAQGKADEALAKAKETETNVLNNIKDSEGKVKDAKTNLETRQKQLDEAQRKYDTAQTNLKKAEEQLETATRKLDKLKQEKEDCKAAIKYAKTLENEKTELSDEIKSRKEECIKMQKKEQEEIKKLQEEYNKHGKRSDELEGKVNAQNGGFDAAADGVKSTRSQRRNMKKAVKAEGKQNDAWAKLQELKSKSLSSVPTFEAAGVSGNDTAGSGSETANISASLEQMAKLSTGIGLMGGSNKQTINGHTVEYKQGKYFVDGSTTGMDRMGAEMLIKTQAFTVPKKPTFS